VETLREIAAGRGKTPAQVALNWLLQQPGVTAPIIGARTPEQLEENVRGSYEKAEPTTPDDRKALDECRRNYFAHLTPEYRWLHRWHYV
jgi:aryl-alcohol dehydrogenase-like predicted oxidoreductase